MSSIHLSDAHPMIMPMIKKKYLIPMIQLVLGTVIWTVLLAQRTPEEFHINLSLPAESRYINLTTTHR